MGKDASWITAILLCPEPEPEDSAWQSDHGSQTMDAFINIIPIPFSYFVWHQIPEFKMVPELMSQKKNVSQVKKSRICL
jgi:hypothetical protein